MSSACRMASPSATEPSTSQVQDWLDFLNAGLSPDEPREEVEPMLIEGDGTAPETAPAAQPTAPPTLQDLLEIINPTGHSQSRLSEEHKKTVQEILDKQDVVADHEVSKLKSFYLQPHRSQLHTSKKSISQLLGVGVEHIEPKLSVLAEALESISRTKPCTLTCRSSWPLHL